MTTEALSLENLEDQVRSLTVAETPAEVFKTLLEGARVAAPRACVFLVRQNELKGWGAIGYPPEAARKQRGYVGPVTEGWLGEVLQSEPPLHSTNAAAALPSFGQPAPGECVGVAIRLKGRPIALIVIERIEGELPWHPSVLGILVRVAQMKLDLDLMRRKLGAAGGRPAPAAGAAGGPSARTATATQVTAPLATPAAPAKIETAPVSVSGAEEEQVSVAEVAAAAPETTTKATPGESPQLEAARRYARLVATDIRLYNEESVLLGRRDGDLADRLQDSLARGKETFQRRHADLGPAGLQILRDAFTEVLAGGQADLIPASIVD